MTASGHFIFALSSVIFAKKLELSLALTQGHWGHIIIGGILACLLPDIDHPKSLLGQRLKWLSIPISKVFGHRNMTHSVLAIAGYSVLLSTNLFSQKIVSIDFAHAMIVGYSSHVIADMLTPSGVPLLWPCRWRFRIPILNPTQFPQWEQIFCIILLIYAFLYPLNLHNFINYIH